MNDISVHNNHDATYLSLPLTPSARTHPFRSLVRTALTAALNSKYFFSKSLPLATLPITVTAHTTFSLNCLSFFAMSPTILKVVSSSIVDGGAADTACICRSYRKLVLFHKKV